MVSKASAGANGEMIRDLRELQEALTETWIDRSLPEDWNGLDITAPLETPQTRVTLRLDADMVRWFRRLGPGYQKRINMILRIYWNALVSGRVKSHWDESASTVPFEEMILKLAEQRQLPAPEE